MDSPQPPRETRGVVYAATGAEYTTLARRSARSLRLVMPGMKVDLFTDQDVVDETFARIHRLDNVSPRPKMEALRRSRFDRTIYLDADTIPVAGLHDLFDILDRCVFAAAQAVARPRAMLRDHVGIPRCFPYFNSGVIAMRRVPKTIDLLQKWEQAVVDGVLRFDQPPLRRLVYDLDIPFIVLPLEYNLIHISALDAWEDFFGAPRVLHVRALHDVPAGDPTIPIDLDDALGTTRADRVRALLAQTVRGPNGSLHPLVKADDASDGPKNALSQDKQAGTEPITRFE